MHKTALFWLQAFLKQFTANNEIMNNYFAIHCRLELLSTSCVRISLSFLSDGIDKFSLKVSTMLFPASKSIGKTLRGMGDLYLTVSEVDNRLPSLAQSVEMRLTSASISFGTSRKLEIMKHRLV